MTPCPLCGADAVYGESDGFLRGTTYVCDECGYEPSPDVVRKGRSTGLDVAVEGLDGIDDGTRVLWVDDDALVASAPAAPSDEDDVRVAGATVTWPEVAVEENPDANGDDDVCVPRSDAPDLRVTPVEATTTMDVLLLLRTADPTERKPDVE